MWRRVWIVQSGESGTFLTPQHGSVGYTYRFKEAGHFLSEDEAYEAAIEFCDDGFDVVEIMIDHEPRRQ